MPSDAAPTPQSEPEATPEQYRQRALLLADLGRYDEAAGELAAGLAVAPGDADLLTTAARVHLAADQPTEALVAADTAVAAAPEAIGALVARAMSLADTRRFGDAAEIAIQLLRRWPQDAYAQRTGAALLSESRNGQEALNAAWAAVALAPGEAESHLVLAMVAARLRLFDLAQRAYAEALQLDPALGDAQRDVGVVRLERRRWAAALEQLADAATLTVPDPPAATQPEPAVSRPAGPVLDTFDACAAAIRQAVVYGATSIMVAALIAAVMAPVSGGASRVWAAVIGVAVLVALGLWLSGRLPEPVGGVLRRLRRRDRRLTAATAATGAALVLIMSYAVVGGPVPLIAALALAAGAELLVLLGRH